jgi:hypothetical protein
VLRQLARLTRPLPVAGPGALAVAVYADASGELVVAKESGFEGVACVDDAARLLDVLCDVWARTRDPDVERWARGVLEFVLWMQVDDGRWLNFVYDWSGTRNESGVTSSTGENFWHARALSGVSKAWQSFGDERALTATRRGLEHAIARPVPADVRALHVLSGLRLIGDPGFADVDIIGAVRRWAGEIASCRIAGVLMNNPDEQGEPHLWAHVQEGTLADAGRVLGDEEMVEVARVSARTLWVPIVRSGFDRASVTPYDVASATFSLERLASADPGADWAELAGRARAWFDLVDRSGRAVYDRAAGRVADGVDEGRVSENSGAEANIVAAETLPDDAVASVDVAIPLLPTGSERR